MKTCPECKSQLEDTQDVYKCPVGNQTFGAKIPCKKCKSCEESLYTLSDAHNCNIAIALHCLSHGIHNAAVHIFCRKTLGLTRDELARHYGTTGAIVKDMEENGSIDEAHRAILTDLLRVAAAEVAFVPTVIAF